MAKKHWQELQRSCPLELGMMRMEHEQKMAIDRSCSALSIAIFCSCSMFMFISNSQLAPLELLPMLFLGHDVSLLCPLVLRLKC